jgi:hypothetical protein
VLQFKAMEKEVLLEGLGKFVKIEEDSEEWCGATAKGEKEC